MFVNPTRGRRAVNFTKNVRKILDLGVMNGPSKFLTARKILPLLDLLAKFKQVLVCKCSPNFCSCSQARKAKFLFLLVLAKKSQCSACSRMLAKTIRHPLISSRLPNTYFLKTDVGPPSPWRNTSRKLSEIIQNVFY